MPPDIQMTLGEFGTWLLTAEQNRGQEYALAWMLEEINRQPAKFLAAFKAEGQILLEQRKAKAE